MHELIKYPVQHPVLKKYIRFFWSLKAEQMNINHRFIPQRNINLRLNLSETPQYLFLNGRKNLLEKGFFSGMQDHYTNASLISNGIADMMGICFLPFGMYPFLRIPISEFKNQILGTNEIGFKPASEIIFRLTETPVASERVMILEQILLKVLNADDIIHQNLHELFIRLNQGCSDIKLSEFCERNNISPRTLERIYNKYVGIPAKTYITLNRFHKSLNNLLYVRPSKLSNIAYCNGYFDQMHFIREFKRFAGNTPKAFIQQNNSMLQIGRFK